MSESSPVAATNASFCPDGCQAGEDTSKSPWVSCRGWASSRTSTTYRWPRWSRMPLSSRQSARRITRATSSLGSPAQNRSGPPSAINAIERPSGENTAEYIDSWRAPQIRIASPPSMRIANRWSSSSGPRSEKKAIVRESGANIGQVSLPRECVSRRGRPPR